MTEQQLRRGGLDVTALRRRFSSLSRVTADGHPVAYLDGPGGTQVPESVIEEMSAYLRSANSNIEGEYELSVETDRIIERARSMAGVFVGGDPDCISFGQNMTTLNFNLSRALGRTLRPGDEIITTALDHEANVSPWLLLAQDRDLVVRQVGLREDLTLDMDDLRAKLSDRTRVVAFSLTSNAVGTLTPAREISDLAHSVGALAWVDAVAYAPHRRIDVSAMGCDVLLCSPYKFFGPHLGMAWIRRDLAESLPAERVRPAGQEPPGHRFETGTLSHEAIAGFIAAVEYVASLGAGDDLRLALDTAYQAIEDHESELAHHFMRQFTGLNGVRVAGVASPDAERRVGTFGIVVDGMEPAAVARALGRAGVYTWNGSFYAQNLMEHLGMDVERGLLRAGMVHYNTTQDIDRLICELDRIVTSGTSSA
ncbi:cysteine desulfurase-like protein [Streptomyces sp. NPDC016566]|uniref:cysteine desulfurase-like protein n=1 Tax=Streptomyces sp. NPDC016566 TaxID=3364967 RepID=UPI0036F62472